jgi:hypothetical protein
VRRRELETRRSLRGRLAEVLGHQRLVVDVEPELGEPSRVPRCSRGALLPIVAAARMSGRFRAQLTTTACSWSSAVSPPTIRPSAPALSIQVKGSRIPQPHLEEARGLPASPRVPSRGSEESAAAPTGSIRAYRGGSKSRSVTKLTVGDGGRSVVDGSKPKEV